MSLEEREVVEFRGGVNALCTLATLTLTDIAKDWLCWSDRECGKNILGICFQLFTSRTNKPFRLRWSESLFVSDLAPHLL